MTSATTTLTPSRLDDLRRRTVASLVAGVALGSTGHIAAITVATIVAADMAGSTAWAGAPGAAVVLGAAIGSTLLSRLMVRRGRRIGLATGYTVGVGGAVVATIAVIAHSLPILLLGTTFIGFGNSSNQLSRYTAADLYPMARRASAIGIVVWGATFGAVVGPNLVGLAGGLGVNLGLPAYAGAYFLPVIFVGAAAILSFSMLRPDPYTLADRSALEDDDRHAEGTSLEQILRKPNVAVAMVALVTGQVVMVLIMTMTPLHMTTHGHGLSAVGLVISAHTFGMFALSPISGRLTDRFGSLRVVLSGLAVIAFSAILSAAAPSDGGVLLFVALFLLGYGWNMGYVAGSTMLTAGLGLAERTRIEGVTDSLIWSSAAAASLGSGLVVAAAGYTTLGLMGAAMVGVPVWLLLTRRRAEGTAGSTCRGEAGRHVDGLGQADRQPPSSGPASCPSAAQDRSGHAGRPTGPVQPDLGRRVRVDLAAGRRQRRRGPRVPFCQDDDAGADRQHVAAERRELLVGDLDEPDPEVAEQLPQPDRQQRQVDDREIVGDRRDDRHQVDELRRPAPVRDVEDAHLPADQARELPSALRVRAQRPPDAEQVRAEPERVATFDRAGRLDASDGRDAGGLRPRLDRRRLRDAIWLARSERDRPSVGHEQRVEGIDEVRRVELDVEEMDARAEPGQGLDERIVLATRDREVDRVEEAVCRIIEGGAERESRTLDQDVEERGGHALGAEATVGAGHRRQDSPSPGPGPWG